MAVDYTTTRLIASIKRKISLPDAQNLYSDTALLGFLTEELDSDVIPLVHSVQQEYWVTVQTVPLVQNQTNYTLPVRGIVNGLRLATLVDASGNEIVFPRLQPENTVSAYNWVAPYSVSTLSGFYLEDDHMVVFPASMVTNPTMSARFRYERRPNDLCSTDDAAHITAIVGNVVTVNNIPSTWTTADTFDIIKGTPAFSTRGDDKTITAINTLALTITFTSLPSTVAVGDWVAISGTSPIAQIPYELFNYLCQCAAMKCLEGLADLEPWKAAKAVRDVMQEDALKMLAPRDVGNVQTVINQGGFFDNSTDWGSGSLF